ncbi:16S rRNA (cytosine(967)-C(5))-methyltransferase RsmB [Rosenbergiella australiborealis]|uniref:16S rRNA (cytosine(967)-C(5))-methyltransferase n=1 Tax=Rosenbergiella australiborealis TaxID=1544696 RepID=A0ABS5T4H4_9GAMM|nr:16S rRNA (cytosine(967)-C(5))-methyltransferase RsmB [Rosenbergiella australiborealis]MBT0727252.1 16S rRNA (cytosine(967)-C(5))-methyltransferase RsmB [Rosenbergiella australiborealis]
MKNITNLRGIAAQLIEQVIDKGQSLSTVLPAAQRLLAEKDRALLQELSFGVIRYLPQLDYIILQLMDKPMKGKQRIIHYVIMVGLYQLRHTRVPPHAAIAETVQAAVFLKRQSLKGLVNGVLRTYQRRETEFTFDNIADPIRYLHPSWFITRIKAAWPDDWVSILEANNSRPPMWLRVNQSYISRDRWLVLLQESGFDATATALSPQALCLEKPVGVTALPGFKEGWVTVQDLSAQRCSLYLDPQPGEKILDICAAPGGKTTHILELASTAEVTAVDVDAQRLSRVAENLERLNLTATLICGDGRYPEQWLDDQYFDRILLDAPCSATGVIRRHPDIKWLRRDNDIAELASLQKEILEAAWKRLKSGGTLLYATCSILPEENSRQINTFLSQHPEAIHEILPGGGNNGLQVLPSELGGDGFFYAKILKK